MSSRPFAPASTTSVVFSTVGPYLGLALLAAVTAWVYRQSLAAPFHFDDSLFLQSARVTDPGAWLSNLDPTRPRPFTYLTFHWNYRLSGTDPAGYHAANVAIHLGNVLLLYIVARLLFARHKGASRATVRWLPLAAAGIFALHPIQSEPVNYVYQRCVLLAGLFALLCAWALLAPAQNWKRRVLAWGAALSWLLAVASKESAVVLPLVALAFLWSSAPGSRAFLKSLTRSYRALLLTIAGAAGCAAAILVVLARRGETTLGLRLMANTWSYALAQIQVFAMYLWLLVWPRNLTPEHAFRPEPPLSLFGLGSALLLLIAVAGTGRLRSRDPMASFLAATFLILLLPTSSLVPSADLMFEHRLYLPMIAGSCLAAWGAGRACASWAAGSPGRTGACVALIAVLLAGWAALSRSRTFVWSDDVRLWQDAVLKAPRSPRAHYNLAVAQLRIDREGARGEFLNTLELQPDHAGALYDLGWLEQTAGRPADARAYYLRTLKADPAFWQAHQNLGNLLVLQGRFVEAETHYQAVISQRPDYAPACLSLATLQIRRGSAAAALDTLDRLRAVAPEPVDATLLRADALIGSGRFSDAERELRSLESADSAGTYRARIKDARERITALSTSP